MELFIVLYVIGAMLVWGHDFARNINDGETIGISLIVATIMCLLSWIWIGAILYKITKE